jgi:hypothetical protein
MGRWVNARSLVRLDQSCRLLDRSEGCGEVSELIDRHIGHGMECGVAVLRDWGRGRGRREG